MLLLSVLGCWGLALPLLSQEAELSSSCSPILRAAVCQKQLLQGNRHGLSLGRPKGVVILSSFIFLHPFPSLVSMRKGTEGLVLLEDPEPQQGKELTPTTVTQEPAGMCHRGRIWKHTHLF